MFSLALRLLARAPALSCLRSAVSLRKLIQCCYEQCHFTVRRPQHPRSQHPKSRDQSQSTPQLSIVRQGMYCSQCKECSWQDKHARSAHSQSSPRLRPRVLEECQLSKCIFNTIKRVNQPLQASHQPPKGVAMFPFHKNDYVEIKMSPNSGVTTSAPIGREPLKFGVRVRHRKGNIDPRAFRDCVTWPRALARSRKHAFRARRSRDDFRAKQFAMPARNPHAFAKMVITVTSPNRCLRPWP